MHGESDVSRNQVEAYVTRSYDALCALAYDLGVPRKEDQTPYEFIDSFPAELDSIRDEAHELTELYVRAAYSELEMDKHVLDRLRRFWFSYETVHSRYIR